MLLVLLRLLPRRGGLVWWSRSWLCVGVALLATLGSTSLNTLADPQDIYDQPAEGDEEADPNDEFKNSK